MTGRRDVAATAAIVVALVLVFFLLPLDGQAWVVGALLGGVVLLVLVPLTRWWVRWVGGSARPLRPACEGLLVLLAVLVVVFSAVYYAMETHGGGDFDGLSTRIDALYFAGSRLATFGFRDVTPVSQPAEIVVAAQMLVDLVFIVVAIRVLSWAAGSRAGGGR